MAIAATPVRPAQRSTIRTTIVSFRGHDLVIAVKDPDQVLEPTGVGLSLLAAVEDPATLEVAGCFVLDVGCGSGLYTAALLAAGATHVTALDVNPECAAATAANVAINGLAPSRVEYVTASLADFATARPFDVVVANPPHFPRVPDLPGGGLHTALVGGGDGRSVYDDLIAAADRLVAEDGVLVVAHSSLTDIARTKAEMAQHGFGCATAAITALPIPFAGLAAHRQAITARLAQLREAGRADFDENGFTVHTLIFTREGAAR